MIAPPLECPASAPALTSHQAFRVRGFLGIASYWCLTLAAWSLGLGCLLAITLRLTWKDSVPLLAPFFYATPLALIWTGQAVASVLFFALEKRTIGLCLAMSAAVCYGWWQQTNVVLTSDKPAQPALKVVFWNAARLKSGWEPVAHQITEFSAPLMGFVEAGFDGPNDRARWKRDFPKHQALFFGNGMLLLYQGKRFETKQGRLDKGCYYGQAALEIQNQRLTVVLVDIHSSPLFSRENALANLQDVLRKLPPEEPIVLMGDFNTPDDSVHFRAFREGFQNTFEAAGNGDSATWPVPWPVLAIDQIWINSHCSAHRSWHESSLQSDHRAVIAELSFSE